MSSPQPWDRNPYIRANSLDELLSWEDADFVRCAYATILGRQPDAQGEYYYTNLVRRGESKLKILAGMRHSVEGRAHDPGIAGLDRALKRATRQRLPLIGGLFRALSSDPDRNSFRDRHQRAVLNASTLERYSLHTIGLKLGGIEWLLQQGQGDRSAQATPGAGANQGSSHSPGAQPATELLEELDHLRPMTPLAQFVRSELNRDA